MESKESTNIFEKYDYRDRHVISIDGKEYFAQVQTYYDGAWDYYIKSDDIYLRCFSCIYDDAPLWGMFKGKGESIIDMSFEELFDTYKIWTPITNREYMDVFETI